MHDFRVIQGCIILGDSRIWSLETAQLLASVCELGQIVEAVGHALKAASHHRWRIFIRLFVAFATHLEIKIARNYDRNENRF